MPDFTLNMKMQATNGAGNKSLSGFVLPITSTLVKHTA